MRTTTLAFCFLAATCSIAAQENDHTTAKTKVTEAVNEVQAPAHYYHLEFLLQEVGAEGKPTNARSYTAIVCTGRNQQFSAIRTGSRVPVITGALHGPTMPGDSKLEYQYQYIDVGVNIDTQDIREIGHQLAIQLKAEVSSLAETSPSSAAGPTSDPVIRQNMWQGSVLIPVGKPTIAFSSDSLDSKGSLQLVVTATLIQ